MIFVLMGSLWLASLNASNATSLETSSISNIMVPFFTTATQNSGDPFPLPILTSKGFLVIDICGKILIQIFPPLFM